MLYILIEYNIFEINIHIFLNIHVLHNYYIEINYKITCFKKKKYANYFNYGVIQHF